MANWLTNYKGGWGGFGMEPYRKAIADGYSPLEIAAAIPGSGLAVGSGAQNRLARDLAQYAQSAANADRYASQLQGYESQLQNYQSQLQGYQSQISNLTNQYNSALSQSQLYQQQASQWQTTASDYGKQRDEWMTKANDWEEQFQTKSAEYESARAEADRYREEAVGRQLQGLRGGSTQAGGGYAARNANIASGSPAYRPGSEDNIVKVEKNISATDSVLAKKGPVVQAIRTRSAGAPAQARPQPTGGTGSYYASRFA